MIVPVGQCRHCHCTAKNPCKLRSGDECCWMTTKQDLCSSEPCLIAEENRKKAVALARRQTWPAPWRLLKRDSSGRPYYVRNRKKKGSAV